MYCGIAKSIKSRSTNWWCYRSVASPLLPRVLQMVGRVQINRWPIQRYTEPSVPELLVLLGAGDRRPKWMRTFRLRWNSLGTLQVEI
jgi:hypothetical protein